tara:strand:- start:11547 stop:12677 length:1131 start_codon:yes stop_codon:yes gene_type:complete
MNKLIFRKLSVDIFTFFLLFSLALTSIVWVIQGVNLLDIITEKGHAIKVYFFYTFLTIPKIFSKLLIFTYFLTLFVILIRYDENNEILVFWTNGIKKISFINYIGRLSLLFVLIQLILNLAVVPYTQNLAQQYLKNSSLDFFPKLIEEKRFSNIMRNFTIFVDESDEDGNLKGVYIKEQISKNENKIIIAKEGKLIQDENGFSFKLTDGKIINIDNKGNFNLGFKETTYELSKVKSKTRKYNKLGETNSFFLLSCLEEFFDERKNNKLRCGKSDSYLIKDIYEETYKRVINPIYIIILSLISSLLILKTKINYSQSYVKFLLFTLGFVIILLSELSYKFIFFSYYIEILFITLPILFILIFYLFILFKTKFNFRFL